jgi:alkyl hydroperoxide reductase 1
MSAWSKAHHIKNDEILFLSDEDAKFSQSIGWTQGPRLARYAIVLDKGKVVYAGKDEKGQLSVCDPLLFFS